MTTKPIRRRQYKDPQLGELARDVEARLDSIPTFVRHTMTEIYREPMFIAPADVKSEPFNIYVRAQLDSNLETAVASGDVSYTWLGESRGGVRIDDISGLSTGTKYRLSFLVVV